MRIEQIDRSFGAAVRLARVEARLSQEEVAGRVTEVGYEMSQATVGKIERGERKVTIGEAEALAAALETSTSALVRGPETMTIDIVTQRLRRLRAGVKRALQDFQIGQQVAANMVGALPNGAGEDALIVELILEAPEDVLREVSRDNVATNAHERHREAMEVEEHDSIEDAGSIERGKSDRSSRQRLIEEYEAKFGDTAPPATVTSPVVAAMLYGFASSSATEESSDG
ncbi:helix-turn-helix domain-containing protein [Rathayibacter sp. AY1D1]|uniref:helix-turn-helix domain-containing protein n=1 Tax=Rathayibacter sp. AY1D1 TaxID=2080542 RepID=UPI0015E32112|nr:helix-turn-helix transcriptional regulator [Rathayibacter sp. AY1D1]